MAQSLIQMRVTSAVGSAEGLSLGSSRASASIGRWQLRQRAITASSPSRRLRVSAADGQPAKTAAVSGETSESEVDEKIIPYCDISKKNKKSLGEMEQEFLLALQAFYSGQEPIMTNEEFDLLKEELLWEGSKVVVLSTDEQKFMEASLAYQAGKPFLSDKEYDELKQRLKEKNSEVAIEGPRCSLRTRKAYSDCMVDYVRMTLLNLPAALLALGFVFLIDDLTGFEITYLLELPEPWSFFFTWFVVLPIVFTITQTFTNLGLKDFLILKGPCPNCGHSNLSFFGTILTVSTGQSVNELKCEECGSTLSYCLETRRITLEALPPLPGSKPAAKPQPKRA